MNGGQNRNICFDAFGLGVVRDVGLPWEVGRNLGFLRSMNWTLDAADQTWTIGEGSQNSGIVTD